ncbi:MAG TPA: Rid family hydrolase [Terracidiphilus sp.]|jgi:2-iminobutanoate/2-iminopropanoate deaminase|nr:Rid family hydrolase [Terracidiphilus sp.]
MEFLFTSQNFPFSKAVIHSGRTLETVLTGIPSGSEKPVAGGVVAELEEIFRQLDEVLAAAGIGKAAVVSVRLYLQDVVRDIAPVNQAYHSYFGSHPPNRRAYGVNLQASMLIEAAFVAELGELVKAHE